MLCNKALTLVTVTLLMVVALTPGSAMATTLGTEAEEARFDIQYHVGHNTWTFQYSPEPGVEFNVAAEVFVNVSDMTNEIEGVVLWSGDYTMADGYLKLFRDNMEVSQSTEGINAPENQMDGEWYNPPFDLIPHNYFAELSGVDITFPNGDVAQWEDIASNVVPISNCSYCQ